MRIFEIVVPYEEYIKDKSQERMLLIENHELIDYCIDRKIIKNYQGDNCVVIIYEIGRYYINPSVGLYKHLLKNDLIIKVLTNRKCLNRFCINIRIPIINKEHLDKSLYTADYEIEIFGNGYEDYLYISLLFENLNDAYIIFNNDEYLEFTLNRLIAYKNSKVERNDKNEYFSEKQVYRSERLTIMVKRHQNC